MSDGHPAGLLVGLRQPIIVQGVRRGPRCRYIALMMAYKLHSMFRKQQLGPLLEGL